MEFFSILGEVSQDSMPKSQSAEPDFFVDLILDQVIDSITASSQDYDLKPFFYTPLRDVDAIRFRHEVMQDLQDQHLFETIKSFARAMRTMRANLSQAGQLHYRYQKQRWVVAAVRIYCDAVTTLLRDLSQAVPQSRGFKAFRDYLTDYVASDAFTALLAETATLEADLTAIRYALLIKRNSIKVRNHDSEPDYSVDVQKTFEKFKQDDARDYLVKFSSGTMMNHVEAAILEYVAQLNPEVFASLEGYCSRNSGFLDATIGAFDREVQFYVVYLAYMSRLIRMGLQFCYPQVSDQAKDIYARDCFDVALAQKLMIENATVVCNDFYLEGPERIIVVTGPNQGGKTTFARTFGQLHFLASLGLPVPGREARLILFDNLLTHFEKEEDITNLRGKLQDDLVRIHDVLHQATANSIIIMNEIFTSTTIDDASFLGRKVIERISELDCLCVFVTFIDELASLNERTVSMVSTVVRENPTLRTFKIVRRPADGLSYALTIAEKYGLTYDRLLDRVRP